MTTLVKLLMEDNFYNDLELTFKNGKLIDYKTEHEEWFGDVIDDLVFILKKLKMISFFEDVPDMSVSVPIWTIDDSNDLYIETFHVDEKTGEDIHDRGADVPMKLELFKLKVYEEFGVE